MRNRASFHRLASFRFVLVCALASLASLAVPPTRAQIIFNALVNEPGGAVNRLFEMQGGVVTPVLTGLTADNFPGLSPDGRFITISSPDPLQPFEPSHDLFVHDRLTGQTRKVVDYATFETNGNFVTSTPLFSRLSPDNQWIALKTLVNTSTAQGLSSTPMLTVNRASDGFQVSLVEIGQGNAIDHFRSEYVGIAWHPGGTFFVAPAYVPILTQTGQSTIGVGLASYAFNAGTLQWQRIGQLTQPRIFDAVFPSVIETHILPAISPNGQRIAFFELTWPDALLQGPVQARLAVMNLDGSNGAYLATFNPGFFPGGLTWSQDGAQLIFSIAFQMQVPGVGFQPGGDPATAEIRAVDSVVGGAWTQLPGVNAGFFPSSPMFLSGGVDLDTIPLDLQRLPDGTFLLTAAGLDPALTYQLQSTTTMRQPFGSSQGFTGQQIMNGISITPTPSAWFFRLQQAP